MSSPNPKRSSNSRTRIKPPLEVTLDPWKATFNEALKVSETADFVSHPFGVNLRKAMLMLEPASILMLEVSRELLLRFQTGNAGSERSGSASERKKPLLRGPLPLFSLSIQGILQGCLGGCETCDGDAIRRATHVVQPYLMAELDRTGIAAVLSADTYL